MTTTGEITTEAQPQPQPRTCPSTPPRGRQSPRYPSSLARGDLPLHRRGTSRTYERLEDLLRDAGYKETRVFTPESERAEARAAEKELRQGSVRGGVDAVVGFIAGLIPGGSKNEDSDVDEADNRNTPIYEDSTTWSLPPSPLGNKHTPATTFSLPPLSPTRSYSYTQRPTPLPHYLRPQPSASGSLRTYAQVSAARGYLRHMASTPNMAKRPASTRDSSAERVSLQRSRRQVDQAPPLPSTWLQSVTKAVLGSTSPAVYVGGPSSRRVLTHSSRSAHKSVLRDHTNKPKSAFALPPPLATDLQHPRTTPGVVCTARVICRSAPASRSSSRIGQRTPFVRDAGKRRDSWRGKLPAGGVPSLASTRVENDGWSMQWVDGKRISITLDESDSQNEEEDVDEDEDEGELDLARLLVPAKRQYSIQSLRQHLHQSESTRPLRRRSGLAGDPWLPDTDDSSVLGISSARQSRRGSFTDLDDHVYGWEAMGLPGLDKIGSKRRTGLPGTWADITGSRS